MRAFFYIKVLVLIAALAGVMYAIANMNPETVSKAFQAFGIDPGTSQSPGLQPGGRPVGAGEKRYNICPTRIHAVAWPDGRVVEELRKGLDLKWTSRKEVGATTELSYLEVEKWLSRHCQIVIKPIEMPQDEIAMRPLINITYIDEKKAAVSADPDGRIRWVGPSSETEWFESDDLLEALKELERLGQFQ